MLEKRKEKENKEKMDFEAKQNAVGFFDLLLKIAIREKIDIGQYENKRNTNNTDKTK